MKKLTAMLLSLVMCVSLLAIPAQAAFQPKPIALGPIINIEDPEDPADPVDPEDPGDDDPEDPGASVMSRKGLPGDSDDTPTD